MKIKFSVHALTRIKERFILKEVIKEAIKEPDKIVKSSRLISRYLIKKIYFNQKLNKDHLLMIIGEKEDNVFKIITIIDTSKISKYF